jgi:hypothetical protein
MLINEILVYRYIPKFCISPKWSYLIGRILIGKTLRLDCGCEGECTYKILSRSSKNVREVEGLRVRV